MEREDNFRLKRFKELKIKKAKGNEEDKIVKETCECSQSFDSQESVDESLESILSESESEAIEEEEEAKEIKPIEFLDQRELIGNKDYEPLNMNITITPKQIDRSAEVNQSDTYLRSCMKNEKNIEKEEDSCPTCGNKERNKVRSIAFIDQREIECCGQSQAIDTENDDLCPVCKEEESKNIEFIDQRMIEANNGDIEDEKLCSNCKKKQTKTMNNNNVCGSVKPSKSDVSCKCKKGIEFIDQRDIDGTKTDIQQSASICKQTNVQNLNDNDLCPVCSDKQTKPTRDTNICGSNKSSKSDLPCKCKKEIEFIDQREMNGKKVGTEDRHICGKPETEETVNENLCSVCGNKKNQTQNDVSCKCKRGIEFIDQREINGQKESVCKSPKTQDNIDENVCSVCAIKNSEIKNEKSICGSAKSSKSDVSCKCKKNIEFIDQREINGKRQEENNSKTQDADTNSCSVCGNKESKTKSYKGTCGSAKSSKSDVSCKCKKSIEFIDQREINGKKAAKQDVCKTQGDTDKNVCSICANKKNETKSDKRIWSSPKLSKSDASCKCKKSIEFIDQREINRKKQNESLCKTQVNADRNVCSVCGSKESQTKNDKNICSSAKSSKSDVSCKCKKSIEFIDQREMNGKKAANQDENVCKTQDNSNKTVCSVCGDKKNELKSDKNICGAVKPSKSDVSCKCKKGIEFIDQREINGKRQDENICKTQDNADKSVCSVCGNKESLTKNEKSICGSAKSSKSDVSCKCKKSIEFIDQREIDGKKAAKQDAKVCKTQDTSNKSVCSVCGDKKNESKSDKNICGTVKPSKSDVSCKCKKSIEFIDQREINGKKAGSLKGSVCKAQESTDKNICSVCAVNRNQSKSEKSICGSTKSSKSDVSCKCKKNIEFIDQRDIEKNKSNHKYEENVCYVCKNKSDKTKITKSDSGMVKLSKSFVSCTCKKNIEFIDQREVETSNLSCKMDQQSKVVSNSKENVCPSCTQNNDAEKSEEHIFCLQNIKALVNGIVETVSKCVKSVSQKASMKQMTSKEKSCSSVCGNDNLNEKDVNEPSEENISEFVNSYKETVKIKRLPDNNIIHEQKIVVTRKTEKHVGKFKSDYKFEKEKRIDKFTKKVKRSKSANFNQPGIVKITDSISSKITKGSPLPPSCSGSNKITKKTSETNLSEVVSITSQTISVTSIDLSQVPATCTLKSNVNSKTKPSKTGCTQTSNCSIKSKSVTNDIVQDPKSNKPVDSCCKIKIVSKDDLSKSVHEIEVTPSTIVILKKILSQSNKSASCKSLTKSDNSRNKKPSKDFSCYKPECSCHSIKLPCESKSEPKSLYQKLGQYLNDVNPFKDKTEPSDTKAVSNCSKSQSMKYIPVKSEYSSTPKRKPSKTRSRTNKKKCTCSKSKSKSTLHSCSSSQTDCLCKSSKPSLKPECKCLKSIFTSPDIKENNNKQAEPKNSCSCNANKSRSSDKSNKYSHDCSCNQTKSKSSLRSKKENDSSKCICRKKSSTGETSSQTKQTESVCQTCSKNQVRTNTDSDVVQAKSKCSCKTSNHDNNIRKSNNDCSCSKSKPSESKDHDACKCNKDKTETISCKSASQNKVKGSTKCPYKSSSQFYDSDNYSDTTSQTYSCPSSQDISIQCNASEEISIQTELQCRCNSNNRKQESNQICKCNESKSFNSTKTKQIDKSTSHCSRCKNKIIESKQSRCSCKSKKKESKCSCKSSKQSIDTGSCDQSTEISVASQTCSICASRQDLNSESKVKKLSSKCKCKSNNKDKNKQGCSCSKSKSIDSDEKSCRSMKTNQKDSSKCSCKSSKQSDISVCSDNTVKSVASQTCPKCALRFKGLNCETEEEKPTCSCKNRQSSCKLKDPENERKQKCLCSESKSDNVCKSNKIKETSRCSCKSSKQSIDSDTCSRAVETVNSHTCQKCAKKEDSTVENEKSCSCRKSQCSCKSKKAKKESKEECSCNKSKDMSHTCSSKDEQRLSEDSCSCKSQSSKCPCRLKDDSKVKKECTCADSKQSLLNAEKDCCKCKKEATIKTQDSKCPCKSSEKSLNSDTCSQSSISLSVASQTESKRSSDQSRKSLRFSSDASPTRTIKANSSISPKGSACSMSSRNSCCSIYSTPSSKSQSQTSVASQCSCGKKDASTVTRRTDRYDVRTLRLLTETNVKCPCHSDSSVFRHRRQNNANNNIAKCRSHGDENYFRHC